MKIVAIAGNHDFCFEDYRSDCEDELTNRGYLQDQEVTIDGLRFYGSPGSTTGLSTCSAEPDLMLEGSRLKQSVFWTISL